jgi:hypothetical protein
MGVVVSLKSKWYNFRFHYYMQLYYSCLDENYKEELFKKAYRYKGLDF